MKKIVFSICLLCSLMTLAQNKWIEVDVNDTIWVKATEIKYHIKIENYNSPLFSGVDSLMAATKQNKTNAVKEIEAFLKQKNYTYEPIEQEFEITFFSNREGFTVILNKVEDLKELYAKVSSYSGLNTNFEISKTDSSVNIDKKSYKKLMVRARDKAELIASNAQMEIREVLEVSDVLKTENILNQLAIKDVIFARLSDDMVIHNGIIYKIDKKYLKVKYATK